MAKKNEVTQRGRPARTDELVMFSRRIARPLLERFKHFCEYHVPRRSDTFLLEEALTEYLERHEKKEKK